MKRIFAVVSILLITILLWVSVMGISYYRYNDGVCRHCENGELIFVNATSNTEGNTRYLFKCDNCGDVYTLSFNPTIFK